MNVGSFERAVTSDDCFVAERGEKVIGSGVFNYSFCQSGFIEMLYIQFDYRRNGAGAALVQYLESLCQTPKLVTSPNLQIVVAAGRTIRVPQHRRHRA